MRLLFSITLLSLTNYVFAQTFTDIQATINGIEEGSAIWGDYDGDNDLDCFIVGTDLNTLDYTSGLYQNNLGIFTLLDNELKNIATTNTVASWGDYDNDNDIDLILNSKIYNNEAGVFTDINANLTSLRQGSVSWGDYDNDDDLDLLISGINGSAYLSIIYRNDNGSFVDIGAGLTGIWAGSSQWGDFDNDGDLDILLVGKTGNSGEPNIGKVYGNTSNIFSEIASFDGIGNGSASWGDYDNDGDLDVLTSGNLNSSGSVVPVTKLYNNDEGVLVESSIILTNLVESYVGWVDFDSDGNLDIMITGQNEGGNSETQLYKNESGTNFTPVSTDFVNVYNGSFDWGDYDGDGLLDVIISGVDNTSGFSFNVKIYNQDAITAPTFSLDKSIIEVNEDFVDDQKIVVTADNNIEISYSISPESVDFCSISIDTELGLVTIGSLLNLSGEQMFTITATDNLSPSNTASQDFSLAVVAINDTPSFIMDKNTIEVNEDFVGTESISAILDEVPVDEQGQSIVYSISPDNINFANLEFDQQTGETTFTAIADSSGTQQFSITANDGQSVNNLSIQNFDLIVSPINDAPTIVMINDTIVTSGNTLILVLKVNDKENDELSIVVNSENESIISNNSIGISSIVNNEIYQIVISTSVSNEGSALISITASDDLLQTQSTFSITFEELITGFLDNSEQFPKVYPNPVRDEITIQIKTQNAKVELYDISGQLVFQDEISTQNKTLDLGSINQGTYLLKIIDGNDVYQKKIIKK